MFSLPALTWYRFLGWLGFGLLIYANYGYHKSRIMKKRREEAAGEVGDIVADEGT